MPKLVALKRVYYGSREHAAGETFDASEKDAKALKAVKIAADASEAPTAPAKTAPEPDFGEPPTPRRGRYARRDMQATEAKVMTTEDFSE